MFTTSRYASPDTRKLAKRLAAERGERYLARGKRTIDDLAALARKEGDEDVFILEEKGGKASTIAAMKVDETGRWRWDEERLLNSTVN